MPSASRLSKKYSAIGRPSLTLSESSYSSSRIIVNHPDVELPKFLYCSISSDDIIALSLIKGGIAFFDTRTGNEIGSRIPTPDTWGYPIAFSPDGKWIVIKDDRKFTLDLWNVKTRTHVKTIEQKSGRLFKRITYSADGEKVMVVTHGSSSSSRLVFVWDVKTDRPLKRLEVRAADVAISPNGSQIAIQDRSGIKIIDVSTGYIDRQITLCNDSLQNTNDPEPRIAWSPNGQILASATAEHFRTKLYLLSFTTRGSAQVPILTRLKCPDTTKYVFKLAFSPDSSRVVAVLQDYRTWETTFSIWWTQSGALVETSNETTIGFAELSFAAADGQNFLTCNYARKRHDRDSSLLHHFGVVPTHLQTYMNDPPKFHPSQTPHTIQYSHSISGAINDYASHVTADGWILNTKGEREMWTPWANYELLCSCKPPQKGRTQYRTLEVKDPQTKTIVLIYVIAFEQENVVSNGSPKR